MARNGRTAAPASNDAWTGFGRAQEDKAGFQPYWLCGQVSYVAQRQRKPDSVADRGHCSPHKMRENPPYGMNRGGGGNVGMCWRHCSSDSIVSPSSYPPSLPTRLLRVHDRAGRGKGAGLKGESGQDNGEEEIAFHDGFQGLGLGLAEGLWVVAACEEATNKISSRQEPSLMETDELFFLFLAAWFGLGRRLRALEVTLELPALLPLREVGLVGRRLEPID